jgi:hypothetical protein
LRLLTNPETFDLSLQVYRLVGWPLLRSTVIPTLFCVASIEFLFRYVIPGYSYTQVGTHQNEQILQAIGLTAVALLVAGPLFLIGLSMSAALASSLVSDFMIGNVPDIRAATGALRRTLGRLLVVGLRETLISCSGLIVSAGLLFLSGYLNQVMGPEEVLPGVIYVFGCVGLVAGFVVLAWVLCVDALAAPAAVIENLKAGPAARRSRKLMRAFFMHPGAHDRVIYLYMLLAFVTGAFAIASATFQELVGYSALPIKLGLQGEPAQLATEILRVIPSFVTLWTIIPVWAVTTTIIYYERRVRLEGYDIEALAADVWRTDRQNRFEL